MEEKRLPEEKLLPILKEIEATETSFVENTNKLRNLLTKENLKSLNFKDKVMVRFFLLPYQAFLNQTTQNPFPKIRKQTNIKVTLQSILIWIEKINTSPFEIGIKNFKAFQELLNQIFNESRKNNPHYKKIASQLPKDTDVSKEFSSLIIQLIQRYPRYVLLIGQLLDYTKGSSAANEVGRVQTILKKNADIINVSPDEGIQKLTPEFAFDYIKEELKETKKIPKDILNLINTSKTYDQLLQTLTHHQPQDSVSKTLLTKLRNLHTEITSLLYIKPEETADEKDAKNSIKIELETQTSNLIKQITTSPFLDGSLVLIDCLSLLNNEMAADVFLEKYMTTEVETLPEISNILAEVIGIATIENALTKSTIFQPNKSEAEERQQRQLDSQKHELKKVRKQLQEAERQLTEERERLEQQLARKQEEAQRQLIEERERLRQELENAQKQLALKKEDDKPQPAASSYQNVMEAILSQDKISEEKNGDQEAIHPTTALVTSTVEQPRVYVEQTNQDKPGNIVHFYPGAEISVTFFEGDSDHLQSPGF